MLTITLPSCVETKKFTIILIYMKFTNNSSTYNCFWINFKLCKKNSILMERKIYN